MATTTESGPVAPAPRGGGLRLAQKIAVNSASQAVSQLFAALVGILSVAIAARYLSVSQYGMVTTAVVLTSLAFFAADFGITPTAARLMARDGADARRIGASAFWAGIMFNAVTIAALFVISRVAYAGQDDGTTRTAVLVLLSAYVLKPWSGVTRATAVVEQRQYLMSLANMLGRGISLVVLIGAVLLDLGPVAVAVGFATGMVLEDVFCLLFLRPQLGVVPDRRPGRLREVIASAVPLGTVLVVNGLYFKTAALMLSLLAGPAEVALYGVAYKGFEVLIALPGFVMITLLPELARLDAGEPRFNGLVQKAFTAMTLLALPIVGMSLCGTEIMRVLGGSQYGEAGGLLALVLASVTLSCVQAVFGYTLVSQGRQGVLLKVSVTVLAVNVALNAALIPPLGINGSGFALLAAEVVSFGLTLMAYRSVAPLPRLQIGGRAVVALACMLAATSVRLLFDSALPGLLVAGIVGVAVYAAVLLVLRAVPDDLRRGAAGLLRLHRPGSAT